MATDPYHVTVTREDGLWVAVVGGVRGGATESRRLAALETEVLDLLSGLLEVDLAPDQLIWDYGQALGPAASKRLRTYERAREQLHRAQYEYEHTQADAVYELRHTDVSLRDAAALLGISFQRVQQLATATRE